MRFPNPISFCPAPFSLTTTFFVKSTLSAPGLQDGSISETVYFRSHPLVLASVPHSPQSRQSSPESYFEVFLNLHL